MSQKIKSFSFLRAPVGLIPGSARTPDIYYADNPQASRVALLTFLTLWHFDAPVQRIINDRLKRMICAFSSQSGGATMESCAVATMQYPPSDIAAEPDVITEPPMTLKLSPLIHTTTSSGKSTIGRFFHHIDVMAIYALSDNQDEQGRHSAGMQNFLKKLEQKIDPLPLADKFHRHVSDFPLASQVMTELLGELSKTSGPPELARLLRQETETSSIFEAVPSTVGHEVGHLLEPEILAALGMRGQNAYPASMLKEIRECISPSNGSFAYYLEPQEALAELAGTALLERVRHNAQLIVPLRTDGLETVLPRSYELVQYAIKEISRSAPAVTHSRDFGL